MELCVDAWDDRNAGTSRFIYVYEEGKDGWMIIFVLPLRGLFLLGKGRGAKEM